MTADTYYFILYLWIALAIIIFPLLLKVTAPYGRHSRKDWGPMIPNKVAWIVMELPSLILFMIFFWYGTNIQNYITVIFFILYAMHYTNRALIFPFRTHTTNKKMPLIIAVFAIVFSFLMGTVVLTLALGFSLNILLMFL